MTACNRRDEVKRLPAFASCVWLLLVATFYHQKNLVNAKASIPMAALSSW